MANLYVHEHNGLIWNEPDYVRNNSSLFELFTSGRRFFLQGVRFLQEESTEWNDHIREQRGALYGIGHTQQNIENRIATIFKPPQIVALTSFGGIKYDICMSEHDHNDGCLYENYIADSEQDIVGRIFVPEKRIVILPYNNSKTRLFLNEDKAIFQGSYFYDGNIRDALSEFEANGFDFHLARRLSVTDEIEKFIRLPAWKRFVITKENVSLEEIFSRND